MTDTNYRPYNESPSCPICGTGNKTVLQFKKDKYFIHCCGECTIFFVYPQPSGEELMALYHDDYFKRGNKYTLKAEDPNLDPNRQNDLFKIQLVSRYKTSGRLLDVGCAMGGFLQVAQENGYEVVGLEVSEFAANHVRQNLGIEVANCDLPSACLSAGSFDVITLWDVIEHLGDPHPTLTEAYRILRPGGLLLLSTGDAASKWARLTGRYWHLFTPPPQHLFFYTPKSVYKVLEINKFSIKKILYPGKRTTMDFILFKACETFGPVVGPIRALISSVRLSNLQLYVNLRDIMTLVAEKTTDNK